MVLDAWLMIHDCVSPMTKCSQFMCEYLLSQRRTCENQRENFGTRITNANLYREQASFIKGRKKRETKLNNKINKKPLMPCCWLDSTSSIPIDFDSYSGGDLGKH